MPSDVNPGRVNDTSVSVVFMLTVVVTVPSVMVAVPATALFSVIVPVTVYKFVACTQAPGTAETPMVQAGGGGVQAAGAL